METEKSFMDIFGMVLVGIFSLGCMGIIYKLATIPRDKLPKSLITFRFFYKRRER